MTFNPILAERRFGVGLAPGLAPATDAGQMLARLTGPDTAAQAYPIETFDTFRARLNELRALRQRYKGNMQSEVAQAELRKIKRSASEAQAHWLRQHIQRRTTTQDGLRERMVFFWADHFTAQGKTVLIRRATSPYVEEAIRPHVAGRFADMLKAAVTHPLMLHYLDQIRSMGPNSLRAKKRGNAAGLNENLAREVLELHTLGVDGPYTQEDVRQLAELFTGLSYDPRKGFTFRRQFVEPGPETVLGKEYGTRRSQLSDIHAVLEDLAAHPDTARHIARKLAVHFVSDTPSDALVDHIAARFLSTGGQLSETYAALLEHPDAWAPEGGNVAWPFDFVSAAVRALGANPERLAAATPRQITRGFGAPMLRMGQAWEHSPGPDGLSEADADWITPPGVAARVQWAMSAPLALQPDLPDPREFVETALGPDAPASVRFAAKAAETRWEGVGLVLASPAFQRR